MNQVKLADLVRFVLEKRKGKAFAGYSEVTIADCILKSAEAGLLRYAVNVEGDICGIVVVTEDAEQKILHITDILVTERWVLPTFIIEFLKAKFGYNIAGLACNGNYKTYKTDRLCRLILKGKQPHGLN